ncbi:ATPase, AFG1-like protein [Cynara cardunculus var. scolymus]|uniref:ATPase, AFG1-like protein n=1 Tax=Cynara cardunculus var. scolymus TaxID=59895 RepID=A0A118JTR1_CYNCS|nr:ATPase, AFG1-like protein [Cynara cardunculus var. scolymus]
MDKLDGPTVGHVNSLRVGGTLHPSLCLYKSSMAIALPIPMIQEQNPISLNNDNDDYESPHFFLWFATRSRTSCFRINALRRYCDHRQFSANKHPGPVTQYKKLVKEGQLQFDPYQEKVALELDNLLTRLKQYEKEMEEYHEKLAKWEENRENERRRLLLKEAESKQYRSESIEKTHNRFLGRWLDRKKPVNVESGVGKWVSYLNRERKLDSVVGRRPSVPPAPKGLYIYGNVGSGKTMLMDMFYSATKGVVTHRRRFHFHEASAMLEINEHMHKVWKNQVHEKSMQSSLANWIMNLPFDTKVKEWVAAEESYKEEMQLKNILPAVADKFLVDQRSDRRGASILCFDEIQTVDVFAIVALSGIISRLLSTGTVLVATSNRAPSDLNQDGMQWEIFLKLLAKLEDHCGTVLIGSETDYRRLISQQSINRVTYFYPLNDIAIRNFENMWDDIIGNFGGLVKSETISVMFGRTLEVPESCNGVARLTFEYLCGRPVGAADYIAVARNYHTVFISDIPMMSMQIRDKFETEAEGSKLRRDVLAEGNIGSGGAPAGITSMLSGKEEMFAFRRAVSRLIEMQTPLYQEGVRLYHPLFQADRNGLEGHNITNILPA